MITRPRDAARIALMPSLAQSLRYICSTNTFLTCAAGGDLEVQSPSVCRFVRCKPKPLTPTSIVDGLCKHSAGKSFGVQVLNSDQAVVIYDPSTDAMMKVLTLGLHVYVGALQERYSVASTSRSLFAPCDSSLSHAQLSLSLLVISRISNRRSVTQGGERSQANVNANHVWIEGQALWYVLAGKYSKPSPCLALDGHSFDRAPNWAVQFNSDLSDFGYAQLVSVKDVADLPEGYRVVTTKGVESGIACFLFGFYPTKERLECLIDSGNGILKNVAMYRGHIGSISANVRQLVDLVKTTNRFALKVPRIASFLQSGVIKLAANRKLIVKRLRLALAGIDSVLVRFNCHCRSWLLTKVLGWLGGFASVEPFVL